MVFLLEMGKLHSSQGEEQQSHHNPHVGEVSTGSCHLPSTFTHCHICLQKRITWKAQQHHHHSHMSSCILCFLGWASGSFLPVFVFSDCHSCGSTKPQARLGRTVLGSLQGKLSSQHGIPMCYPLLRLFVVVLLLLEQSSSRGSLPLQSNTASFSPSCQETMGSLVCT